jgi:hypothetical protein
MFDISQTVKQGRGAVERGQLSPCTATTTSSAPRSRADAAAMHPAITVLTKRAGARMDHPVEELIRHRVGVYQPRL